MYHFGDADISGHDLWSSTHRGTCLLYSTVVIIMQSAYPHTHHQGHSIRVVPVPTVFLWHK